MTSWISTSTGTDWPASEQPMVQPERIIQGVHLMIVEDADPVGQLADIDGEHLLKKDPALLPLDLSSASRAVRPPLPWPR
jgi:hypothetical protein